VTRNESILAAALLLEIAVFAAIAPRFFSIANGFEILRASVELGLLAIALTPIIVTGGIDVSVGAMMGLAAIVFGAAITDWHAGVAGAIAAALVAGAAGGALNALLVARLDIPPLIVTLGSMSLFRGIAEGLTGAAVNYTGFPSAAISGASFRGRCRCSRRSSPATWCCCTGRPRAARSTPLASAPPARATRGSTCGGGWPACTC
jgi:rhamnose transport system permease protein